MTGVGAALLFVGAYLMYAAYEAIHTQRQAQPVVSAKAALH